MLDFANAERERAVARVVVVHVLVAASRLTDECAGGRYLPTTRYLRAFGVTRLAGGSVAAVVGAARLGDRWCWGAV